MKRFLAMLLCLTMLLSMSPLAYATAEDFAPETAAEEPGTEPTDEPIEEPVEEPTEAPVPEPTEEPAEEPTEEPTVEPVEEPIPEPVEEPTPEPTEEPTPEPTEEPEELLPVRVSFLCEPAELTLTVWEKTAKESETAEEPAVPIAPQEDGSWLLLPGEYVYSAECEGYEPLVLKPLSVSEETEVSVTLAPCVTSFGTGSIIDQGLCGDALIWKLDSAGTLTIHGTGEMGDFSKYPFSPWNDHDSSIRKVIIENGVTNIGPGAFSNCNMTSVSIARSVKWIGVEAFDGCSSLTSVDIPDSVTVIGGAAFRDCTSLTSIRFLFGLTGIANDTFSGCTALTSISIPEGVRSIGSSAFYGCSSLTSVNLPRGLRIIDQFAFSECSSLESINIPDGVTEIGYQAFAHCKALASVNIPDSVTVLDEGAFGDCSSLTSIIIPDSITYIARETFAYCTGLTNITIPSSVTAIDYMAFFHCHALTSVTIPDSVTYIDDLAFAFCLSLTSATIPGSVTSIGSAFLRCESLVSVTIQPGVTSMAGTFSGCSELTSVTIPNSITVIEGDTFSGCNNLTSIIIPEGVTTIGDSVFSRCNSLTSVSMPDSVTTIGASVFYSCDKLVSVNIPEGVTKIEKDTFAFCSSLPSINIPVSVTAIDQHVFYGCDALRNVYYGGMKAQWNAITIGSDNEPLTKARLHYTEPATSGSFGVNLSWTLDGNNVLTITGSGSMGEDPTHSWSIFNPYITKVVIEEGVTDIGANTFAGCSSLTSVTLPKSVTKIGADAFAGCTALTEAVYLGTSEEWAQVQVASGNDALTACLSFNPPASGLSIKTAGGEPVPEEIDMLAQPTLALKAVLEPAESQREIEWWPSSDVATVDENGLVTFRNVGEVTINAMTPDNGVGDMITLNVFYGDKGAELTAATDRPTSGMNSGETATFSVFGEDKETPIAAEKLSFISDNEKVATVDASGVITTAGIGTATVTATFRGNDPLGRSVSVVVTVTPDSGAKSFTVDGEETAELHIEKADTARTLLLTLVNDKGEELDITRFTLKSSDAKVAKAGKITNKKDANYGEYALTIPKNATGACTITATPKDKTLKGAETTLAVFVEDYAPRLGAKKLTLNSYRTEGVSTSLVPSYGNEITGEIQVFEKAGKVYAETESTRLKASYADDVLTITTVDGGPIAKNQTINVRLVIPTVKGEQTADLAVTVKNALPKVTVKQTQKKNLFYTDSEGVFTVTVKDAEIAAMSYNIGGTLYAGSDGTITVGETNGAKKGDLTVEFEGYNTAYVKKSLAFATVNTKPALTAAPTSGTISAEGDVDYAILNIYNKTAKENLNLDTCDITATEGYGVSTSGEELILMPDAELLNVAKKTAKRVTLQIQGENWESPITVRYTLNIQPKKTLPVAKLGTATLTLNLKYPEAAAETTLTLDQMNRSIDEAEFICAKTGAIDVNYENGAVTARLNGGTVKAGSYSFVGTVTSAGDTLKTVKLTVKVIGSNASATVKASGKLDAVQRATSGITYTVTVKNINGIIEDVQMLSPTGKLSKTVVDGSELFDLAVYEDMKGQPVLYLTLKPGEEYSTKLTYKLRFGFMVNGSWISTGDVSVKVTQSAIKVKAENASQTVYQSQDRSKTLSYKISLTSPANARIGTIEIGKLNSAFRKSLADAASSISWDIAPDGRSATVRVRINDTSKLVSGKTYTLPLVISGEGTAGGASAKINLTMKAAK